MNTFTRSKLDLISFLCFVMLFVNPSKQDEYGPGFYNHTDCLYAYQEGGKFELLMADGKTFNQNLTLDDLSYDSSKSQCVDGSKPGKVTFSYNIGKKIKSIQVSMAIRFSSDRTTWSVSQANLTVYRTGKRTHPILVQDIYAASDHSYSCSRLTLESYQRKKTDLNETGKLEPRASITLNRFQLQPFGASENFVFSESYDCSVWFSTPTLLGFILIIFMFALGIGPIYYLLNIEPGDFKYTKKAQQFTQSQLESNKIERS